MGLFKPKRRKRETKLAGPRPRTQPKAAVKRKCIRGHTLEPDQSGWSCEQCRAEDERKAQIAALPVWPDGIPREMVMREVESGRMIRFAIPPHCRRRG